MNTLLKVFFLGIGVITSSIGWCGGGSIVDRGGDGCVGKFKSIAYEIVEFLDRNAEMKSRYGYSIISKLQQRLMNAKVVESSDAKIIDPVTGFPVQAGNSDSGLILIGQEFCGSVSREQQYILVAHEGLGMVGLENSQQYPHSSQLVRAMFADFDKNDRGYHRTRVVSYCGSNIRFADLVASQGRVGDDRVIQVWFKNAFLQHLREDSSRADVMHRFLEEPSYLSRIQLYSQQIQTCNFDWKTNQTTGATRVLGRDALMLTPVQSISVKVSGLFFGKVEETFSLGKTTQISVYGKGVFEVIPVWISKEGWVEFKCVRSGMTHVKEDQDSCPVFEGYFVEHAGRLAFEKFTGKPESSMSLHRVAEKYSDFIVDFEI